MLENRLSLPLCLFPCLCVALAVLLTGCPTEGRRDTFDYLRSPVTFRIDPAAADHPYCFDAAKRPGLTEQECRDARKYRLRWDRPEDTVGFAEYRVYVDTTPPNSALPWSGTRKDRALASFILEGSPPGADSILFLLSDTGSVPRFLSRAAPGVVPLDTTGRLDSTGALVFSIVTAYGESGMDGQPRYTLIITDDRFPPFSPLPRMTPKARGVEIEWERPRDPTSFFDPGADSGVIREYFLRVVRGGILNTNRPAFNPAVVYSAGGVDRTAEVDTSSFTTPRNAPGRLFRLPDHQRVHNRNAPDYRDSLRVTLTGLSPQDTVDISLWALDSSGNFNPDDASAFTRVLLTDTTQPTAPRLRVFPATVGRNGFVYAFTASRDLVESGGGPVPSSQPNANILEYRLSRRRTGDSTNVEARRDTVIQVPADRRNDTLFTDTVRYLPPGATYRIRAYAVDSTGHLSDPDSLDVSTLASAFPGPDSAAACPPGFIAMPGGRFLRGDTTATVSGADEKPAVMRYMESYCIEAYEHRDNTGAFATRKTWKQAHDICAGLSASLETGDSTWLCTEAEWERACEGTEPDVPLVYGMQSEKLNAAEVRYACNIGTGDSVMALTPAKRDPGCISYEGAFDMAGNLSEWVLDPATLQGSSNTMASYPSTPDTLRRGAPHTPVTASSVRGFRGGHYLNPGLSPAILLRQARCSNRDFATQSRPRTYAGCVDSTGPQLVVLYNNASKPPRCLPLPDSIQASRIDTVTPARDSSRILILLKGLAQPVEYDMNAGGVDPVYTVAGLKPTSAGLTRQTLAIVAFRNSETLETVTDTLDATELRDRTEADRALVFGREAAAPWAAVKENGQYVIRYRYAHVQVRNVPAKAYYSNTALGFRCCARPRPQP